MLDESFLPNASRVKFIDYWDSLLYQEDEQEKEAKARKKKK
ncbi:MAG TPA: hypothetical protein VJG31_04430 [Candidatus Nanoarchaeia archaeon]|nr:hypothetical protein [Candidatus Nanoarchaeia archaeon]